MISQQYGSTKFDSQFDAIENLTWRPWVGDNFTYEGSLRLLVVGESHYINGEENSTNEVNGETIERDQWKDYNRATVREAFVNNEWRTPMHTNIHRLLLGTTEFDREKFWSESSYLNIVQRPMDYSIKEQASAEDFINGWVALIDIIKIIKPTHCVMVGSRSSAYFNKSMLKLGVNYIPVEHIDKVGRYVARMAEISFDNCSLRIPFVKHASSYFSWPSWKEFLQQHSPELMSRIESKTF